MPDFASNPSFVGPLPEPSDQYEGQPTKVAMTEAQRANGFVPDQPIAAEHLNAELNALSARAAGSVPYTPVESDRWLDPDPTQVAEALDALARKPEYKSGGARSSVSFSTAPLTGATFYSHANWTSQVSGACRFEGLLIFNRSDTTPVDCIVELLLNDAVQAALTIPMPTVLGARSTKVTGFVSSLGFPLGSTAASTKFLGNLHAFGPAGEAATARYNDAEAVTIDASVPVQVRVQARMSIVQAGVTIAWLHPMMHRVS